MEKNMKRWMKQFLRDECGATAIEYGLIASLIAVIIIASTRAMGTKLSATFSKVNGAL
jgi:pilus assembly protein Flp/PilA